jgi:hypothetical protein
MEEEFASDCVCVCVCVWQIHFSWGLCSEHQLIDCLIIPVFWGTNTLRTSHSSVQLKPFRCGWCSRTSWRCASSTVPLQPVLLATLHNLDLVSSCGREGGSVQGHFKPCDAWKAPWMGPPAVPGWEDSLWQPGPAGRGSHRRVLDRRVGAMTPDLARDKEGAQFFCDGFFEIWSCEHLPGLGLNCNPSDLCLLSS